MGRSMKIAANELGDKPFKVKDRLIAKQIATYSSRRASKKRQESVQKTHESRIHRTQMGPSDSGSWTHSKRMEQHMSLRTKQQKRLTVKYGDSSTGSPLNSSKSWTILLA